MDPLKLKLEKLGYQTLPEFKHGHKLDRFYFEQQNKKPTLPVFIGVCKWLFQLNKIQTKWTNETDISKVLEEINGILKSLKISVPLSVLKVGFGPEIVVALNSLCDRVLPRNSKLEYQQSITVGEAKQRQVEYQFIDEQIEKQGGIDYKVDAFIPYFKEFSNYSVPDALNWSAEVEQLDFSELIIKNKGDQWRLRWEHYNALYSTIQQDTIKLQEPLRELINLNSESLEKITAREQHLNQSCDSQVLYIHLDTVIQGRIH